MSNLILGSVPASQSAHIIGAATGGSTAGQNALGYVIVPPQSSIGTGGGGTNTGSGPGMRAITSGTADYWAADPMVAVAAQNIVASMPSLTGIPAFGTPGADTGDTAGQSTLTQGSGGRSTSSMQDAGAPGREGMVVQTTAAASGTITTSTFNWPSLQPTTPPTYTAPTLQQAESEAVQYFFESILQRQPTAGETTTYVNEINAHPEGNGNYDASYAVSDIAHLQETTNKLQGTFESDLGANASSDLISSGEAYLSQYVTYSQLAAAITSSSAESNAITAAWKAVLSRSPDASTISSDESALNNGSSLVAERTSLAQSQEAQNDINTIFEQVLGRPVDSGTLTTDENGLASGTSMAQLRTSVAQSQEAQNDINTIFEQVLNRPVDSGTLTTDENGLANGTSMAQLRTSAAQSQEAQNDINTVFEQVLNRPVDSGTLTTDENGLASGTSMAQLRTSVAQSQEAQNDIDAIYQQVLGRNANSSDTGYITSLQTAEANGSTLAASRASIAHSSEAAADINTIYQQVLGRSVGSADASNVAALQTAEANGSTLAASRASIAHSSEAAADINTIYQQVLGRSVGSADASNVAALQTAEANGSTLAASRASIAHSSEAAADINTIYQQVLGRSVGSADASNVAALQTAEANGSTLAASRASIASSSEAAADINTIYQQILNRPVDSGTLSSTESSLGGGATLAQVRSNVAYSAEAVADMGAYGTFLFGSGETVTTSGWESSEESAVAAGQATLDSSFVALEQGSVGVAAIGGVYADNGQAAPSGAALQGAATALVNLAYAWRVVQGQSQSQWTSEAGSYQAQSGVGSFAVTVSNLAGSQAQAVALVASGLVNSWMDAAPDQASASASFAAGGEQAQDNLIDQADGLDAVALQPSLGNPTPCDPTTFQAQHVTGITNTTVAQLNTDPNHPGPIKWGGGIQGQGYPYESYVTSVLNNGTVPGPYEQTVPNFPAFDQWNLGSGIAVSDKTLNTGTDSYQASPSRITTMMVKYALKMLRFTQGGSASAPITFRQAQITSFSFYMAVPSGTTDPQWQAICLGYQDMKTLCSTQPATDGKVKSVSIVINSVSG